MKRSIAASENPDLVVRKPSGLRAAQVLPRRMHGRARVHPDGELGDKFLTDSENISVIYILEYRTS
jgi:hypothetical protein